MEKFEVVDKPEFRPEARSGQWDATIDALLCVAEGKCIKVALTTRSEVGNYRAKLTQALKTRRPDLKLNTRSTPEGLFMWSSKREEADNCDGGVPLA